MPTTCSPTATRSRFAISVRPATRSGPLLYETSGNPLFQPERFDVASIEDTYTLSPTHGEPIPGRFAQVDLEPVLQQCVYLLEHLGMNVPADRHR